MADFEKSMEVLDSWEGGYSSNPKDPGGETYCGISRKKWPNWDGWKAIDELKKVFPNDKIPWNRKFGDDVTWKGQTLPSLVSKFYLDNFWSKQSFNLIDSQEIADKIFQHYVNMGNRAIKLAQAAVGLAPTPTSQDGIIGRVTLAALNAYNDVNEVINFLGAYVVKLESYYEELIGTNPQLHIFETEWMLRAKTLGKRP